MKSRILFVSFLVFAFVLSSFSPALAADRKSIVKIGGDAFVSAGETVSEVVAIGGNITVAGAVDKDVVAIGGYVNLKPGASVGGDVVSVGGSIIRSKGTIVGGEITEIATIGFAPLTQGFRKMGLGWIFGGALVLRLITLLAFLALAAILVAIFEKHVSKASEIVDKSLWKSFLIGLLGMLVFVPFIGLLAISIIGIPLIPLWCLLFAAAVIMGYIVVSDIIGRRILAAAGKKNIAMILEVLLGLVILGLAGLIPIIGWIVKSAAIAVGLGGVIITRFGTLKTVKAKK